jgi:hypothetical protein
LQRPCRIIVGLDQPQCRFSLHILKFVDGLLHERQYQQERQDLSFARQSEFRPDQDRRVQGRAVVLHRGGSQVAVADELNITAP